MLAYRNGKPTEICDLCGEDMPAFRAYTEGVNRYCSFECMAEVNDIAALVEEMTGMSKEDYPDISEERFLEIARRDSVWQCGHDIGETPEPEEAGEGTVIPVLLTWEEYTGLSERPPAEGDCVFITTPAWTPAREWKASSLVAPLSRPTHAPPDAAAIRCKPRTQKSPLRNSCIRSNVNDIHIITIHIRSQARISIHY